jgi:hypothetical protein
VRNVAADAVRKRDLDAFLAAAGGPPMPPSNALIPYEHADHETVAQTFCAKPGREEVETMYLTEQQREQRADALANHTEALEEHSRAVQELEDIKVKTEALKQRRRDLANPTAPATPPQGHSNLEEHTPTTPGIERSWSQRRAAEKQKPTAAEKQIVTHVRLVRVLLIANKTTTYVSEDPERVVFTLFAMQSRTCATSSRRSSAASRAR